MRIRLITNDAQWSAANGQPTTDGEVIVTVAAEAVEPVTFAGKDMLRFNLHTVAPKLPRDYPNPWVMVPTARVVTD